MKNCWIQVCKKIIDTKPPKDLTDNVCMYNVLLLLNSSLLTLKVQVKDIVEVGSEVKLVLLTKFLQQLFGDSE